VKCSEAIASTGIVRLETSGVAMVCLSYLDTSSPAHMRYTIRRLRRRLPQARIMLGCWLAKPDMGALQDATKPDIVVNTLRDAVRLCLEAPQKPESPAVAERTQVPDGAVNRKPREADLSLIQ
jgi:hypothetical protein